TANYINIYENDRLATTLMSPTHNSCTVTINKFPAFVGCRQFDIPQYDGRPIYAINNNSDRRSLRITISRDFNSDPEALRVEDVVDINGDSIPAWQIDFHPQSIINDGRHWLDKGEFELGIKPR
ncbi:MAG: hypothetical protein K2M55_06655, partial [Muribaculaceae bacterium]|nr:hypothetical protein [Muribaculaceae bacterium]